MMLLVPIPDPLGSLDQHCNHSPPPSPDSCSCKGGAPGPKITAPAATREAFSRAHGAEGDEKSMM
eukprot:CAMPEP_0172036308 /NCGR_PEP_ID=MMETSP1041-20130122/22095_1 /TAXON_ID=464988 /ORGANISM="Hemiselmis andersenii, Strain CCMP439" /LENGTH=64 /DNA_ID=CAMNT_0012693529 /DNA_START=436 /DNA_END=630 /DNA_ORIENTATION=+